MGWTFLALTGSSVCPPFAKNKFCLILNIFTGAGHPGEDDIGGLVLVR